MPEQPLRVSDDDVRERLRKFITESFPLARQKLPGDGDPLLDDGLIDSLGILELVNFMTDAFGVEVSDEDLQPENFHSIDTLVAFVVRKTG